MSGASPRESGSALVLLLVLTASVTAAVTAAIATVNPARWSHQAGECANRRLESVAQALESWYARHGQFPVRLQSLTRSRQVSAATLVDPFRRIGSLGYRVLGRSPDQVLVYSAGPNRRDELGGGDDLRLRVSSCIAGRAVTRERLALLERALHAHARAWCAQQADAASELDYVAALVPGGTSSLVKTLRLPVELGRDGFGVKLLLEESPGQWVRVRSAGADRVAGTADDLVVEFAAGGAGAPGAAAKDERKAEEKR